MSYVFKQSVDELEKINDGLQSQIIELQDKVARRNVQIADLEHRIEKVQLE